MPKCCGLFSQKKPGKEKRWLNNCNILHKLLVELPVGVEGFSVDHWKEIVERKECRDDNYDRTHATHVYCAFNPEAFISLN